MTTEQDILDQEDELGLGILQKIATPDLTIPDTAPSVESVVDLMGILPDKFGQGSLTDVKSIFDPKFQDYVNNLPYANRDQFYNVMGGGKIAYPQLDAKAGQDTGNGLIKDVFGKGLGVVADGLNLLNIPSQYTEQALGVTWSYVTRGFGSDMSLGERWDASKLFYEGLEKDKSWNHALDLAALGNDQEFHDYIKANKGGLIDNGLRFLADPLWLLGGVPVAPGLLKMTKIPLLEGPAEFLAKGYSAETLPLVGKTVIGPAIRALNEAPGPLKVLTKPIAWTLGSIGLNVADRRAAEFLTQWGLHSSIESKILNESELAKAVNQVYNPGWLRSLVDVVAGNRAETTANSLKRVLDITLDHVSTPEEMKVMIDQWKAGREIIGALDSRPREMFDLLNRVDFDSFKSLSGDLGNVAPKLWKQKFADELVRGVGAGSDPSNGLLQIAKEMYEVGEPSAISRITAPVRWLLGVTLLNSPGYAVLNAVNNFFTVGFDALDTFNHDPYGTIGVVGSRFGLFNGYREQRMVENFGENWKAARDFAAQGTHWMNESVGLGRNRHWWDNPVINFGSRLASVVDQSARNMAAELSMLRANHYFGQLGTIAPDFTDELKAMGLPNLSVDDLLKHADAFTNGTASSFLGLRSVMDDAYKGVDSATRVASQDTLFTHLGGVYKNFEDQALTLINNGDRAGLRDLLDSTDAEMKLWNQTAQRLSSKGIVSTPVNYSNIHDLAPKDFAIISDEHTMFSSQLRQMMGAVGFRGSVQTNAFLGGIDNHMVAYTEVRKYIMGDFSKALRNGDATQAKMSVDALESLTKRHKQTITDELNKIVNQAVKVDVNQARILDRTAKRWIESFSAPEDAFRSALRSTYWPRSLPEDEVNRIVSGAIDARANDVRNLFRANVSEGRVGSFAPLPVHSEAPMLSDRFGTYEKVWTDFTSHLRTNLDEVFDRTDKLYREVDMSKLKQFVDDAVRPRIPDIEFAKNFWVREMTDHTMLDYSHQLGVERYIQMVFPYEFWPTRTAINWAQRALAKPGAVASLMKLYDLQGEWERHISDRFQGQIQALQDQLVQKGLTDAEYQAIHKEIEDKTLLSTRMKGKAIIPVPGLNGILHKFGIDTEFAPYIAFDPLAAVFPAIQWTRNYDFDTQPTNFAGRIYEFLNNTGLAVNPLVKSPLSLAGIIGNDQPFDWLRNAGPPALISLGFGPVGQAIQRWYVQNDKGGVDAVSKALGVDVPQFFLENGYGPYGLLNYLGNEIMGTDPRDAKNFEIFAATRTLASLAAEDKRLVTLEQERRLRYSRGEDHATVDKDIDARREAVSEEYVKAFNDKSGRLWNQALKASRDQQGLRDISRYLFGMGGVNVMQRGELIQNGLEFLQNAVNQVGDSDQRKAFYDAFPEFTPRTIQDLVLNDPEESRLRAKESLYYWDQQQIVSTYEQRLAGTQQNIDAIDQKIKGIEDNGGLTSRVQREARADLYDKRAKYADERQAIYDERQKDFDRIDALYGKPRNSTAKNPFDRAVDNAKDEWFQIQRITDDIQRQAAQDAFLNRFPPARDSGPMEWIILGAQGQAAREKARIGSYDRSTEDQRHVDEATDRHIEELTAQATNYITRRDIEAALSLNSLMPPSGQLAEYKQAQDLMTKYVAIGDLGLSDDEERRRKEAYWDSNPLLEKYYGRESYFAGQPIAIQKSLERWYSIYDNAPDNPQQSSAYFKQYSKELSALRAQLGPMGLIGSQDSNSARLAQIWDGYYALLEKSRAREDYYNNHIQEIRQLQLTVSRPTTQQQSYKDVARERQIWDHYYSLPPGDARDAYLLMVQDELNDIRTRLSKEPMVDVGFVQDNPRLSDSAPLLPEDIQSLFAGVGL